MSMKKLIILSGAAALMASAHAGVWNEINAPDLPPGETTIGFGALTEIRGYLQANWADLYCIHITDYQNFRATTEGGATFDTQLWLFKMDGMGVSFNDDSENGSTLQSTLTSRFLTGNGHYVIGISRYNRDAVDAGGALLWNNSPFRAERAPDGPGRNNPIAGWVNATADSGNYSIFLQGAEYCEIPEPATLAALGLGAVSLIARRRRK